MGRFLALALLPLILALFIVANVLQINPFQKELPCANSISCIKDLSGKFEPSAGKAVFLGRNIGTPTLFAQNEPQSAVLGQSVNPNKHIYVDLSTQTLYAYDGQSLVYTFPVSTGKWGPTPTGDFKIWVKLRYTRMTGGEGADFYDLPNVPFVMFFYNGQVPASRGFSIHGAYWHNNFGHPMSHGCVNVKPENAEKLYNWADPPTTGNTTYADSNSPGTMVTIYGSPPTE